MVTLQTADNALRNFYLDAIAKEIDGKASPFLAKLEQTSANVVGKGISKIIKVGMHSGVGAGTEAGDLPKGEDGSYITLSAPLKNLYGTIEITDKAIRASANNEGAFVNLLNEEMDGLLKSAKYNFGRMLFSDGNGTIAEVTSVSGDMLTLSNVQGLMVGMYVDVWKAGVKTHSKVKVAEVVKDTREIRLQNAATSSNVTPPVNSVIKAVGSEDGYELTGLGALFSETDIYGVDRTNAYMRPYVQEDIGELNEDVLQLAIDTIEENSGSKVNFILCSWGVRRALTRCFKEKQSVLSMTDMGDNQYALTYNGIPIVVDRFCPEGRMYLLNTDDFKICQLCDWQWMEGEDGKILKQVPGKPVYTATLVKYAELICEKPCGQGVLKDIAV